MKLKMSQSASRTMYLPREISEMLGREIEGIVNSKTLVLFPEGTDMSVVLKSLDIVIKDIELHLIGKEEILELEYEPIVTIKEEIDKFIFISKNRDRPLTLPKVSIKKQLTRLTVDEIVEILHKQLLDRDIEVELSKLREIVLKC